MGLALKKNATDMEKSEEKQEKSHELDHNNGIQQWQKDPAFYAPVTHFVV